MGTSFVGGKMEASGIFGALFVQTSGEDIQCCLNTLEAKTCIQIT